MTTILVPRHKDGFVRQEGTSVQIILDGQVLMDLTWQSALALSKAIHQVAKKAEEEAHVEQIIFDQAILQRAGSRHGFATRRDIAKEAAKEAAWNSDLRRYMPDQHQASIVYAPTVTQDLPKGD